MSRLRLATRLAPVVVGIAALTVACGSSKGASTVGSSSDTIAPAATTAAAPTSAATSMPGMPTMSASADNNGGGGNSGPYGSGSGGSTAPASTQAAAAGVTVSIKDFQFGAPTGAIKPGDTVTVINMDSVPHTYTAVDGSFDAHTVAPNGGKATFVAPKAGTYQVKCNIHPSMHGTLTVG